MDFINKTTEEAVDTVEVRDAVPYWYSFSVCASIMFLRYHDTSGSTRIGTRTQSSLPSFFSENRDTAASFFLVSLRPRVWHLAIAQAGDGHARIFGVSDE